MSISALGSTAQYIAAGRAIESEHEPDALCSDPWAKSFAGEFGFAFLEGVAEQVGQPPAALATYVGIRTKFMDDIVEAAKHKQLVILAVGGDTRAYRLQLPDDTRVFEVDLPDVIAYRQGLDLPTKRTVTTIAADLSEASWVDELLSSGYDPETASTWVMEGLHMYLPADDSLALLQRMASLMCPGSVLTCDMMNLGMVAPDNEMTAALRKAWTSFGAAYPCGGVARPKAYMQMLGFEVDYYEFGEVEATDYGRVSAASKTFFFETAPRPREDDVEQCEADLVPRNWLVSGKRL